MPRAPSPIIVAEVCRDVTSQGQVTSLLPIVMSALSMSACDSSTVNGTPEALDHARIARIDPDHGTPIGPILSEFGSEAGQGEIVAVDPAGLTIALRHHQLTPPTGRPWS
ncbi:MAG: hypothetical protein A2882_01520 [Phenylobacterium sp. RIFCSPHIGHO2_01_FULL_70_10]|nr:MAG: hypothetical protein A2882_01520 [Phenylobacterium sp. RIFCSPHIGHO2_01_FULL_70_10]